MVTLDQFVKELAHLVLRCRERFFAQGSRAVQASERLAVPVFAGPEIAFFFQALKQGIEAAWADAVAVTGEFLDHAQAENGAFDGVMEDVEADEAGVQVAVIGWIRFRHSITNRSIDLGAALVNDPPDLARARCYIMTRQF